MRRAEGHRLFSGRAQQPARTLPLFPGLYSVVRAAAPHNARMKITLPGRAAPSQTLPTGGLCSPQTPIRGAHIAAMTMGYLWEGRPLPGPPPLGEGTGRLPAGKGVGKPGFPVCSPQARFHSGRFSGAVAPQLHNSTPPPNRLGELSRRGIEGRMVKRI